MASPLVLALQQHAVTAGVTDTDTYRSGLQVDTDYIIKVKSVFGPESQPFRPFLLSKTFHAFRELAAQLKQVSRAHRKGAASGAEAQKILVSIEKDVIKKVEHHSVQYLGKISSSSVKSTNKKRADIIENLLASIFDLFPQDVTSNPFYADISGVVEDFLLTDHCEENDDPEGDASERSAASKKKGKGFKAVSSAVTQPVTSAVSVISKPITSAASAVSKPVVDAASSFSVSNARKAFQSSASGSELRPFSRRQRRSVEVRAADVMDLKAAMDSALEENDDEDVDPKAVPPTKSSMAAASTQPFQIVTDFVEKEPTQAAAVAVAVVALLWVAATKSVTLRIDVEILLLIAAFSAGMQIPRKSAIAPVAAVQPAKSASKKKAARPSLAMPKEDPMHRLLRQSMIISPRGQAAADAAASRFDLGVEDARETEDEDVEYVDSLPRFPAGAKLGSHLNCWSEPEASLFKVRGSNYLQDSKKVSSDDFIFPSRGMDLYLTDLCPENAASNPGVFGGKLREKPSFIVNFRLPWGILLVYYEIPEHLIPFVKARYENGFDSSTLPSIDSMEPGDRCAARFLLGSDEHRNQTLKIVPMVVQGPWIVKKAVGGKPAILGKSLPVSYFYDAGDASKNKAMYLEADLDIVASSAARGILSMVRSYTQSLTIDLGFVIQGNTADELPERMLTGCRIHGLDPLNAPAYPLSSQATISGLYDDDSGGE